MASFRAELADGRVVVVDASNMDSARRLAREQAGGVGVTKVESYTKAKQDADAKEAEKAAEAAAEDASDDDGKS